MLLRSELDRGDCDDGLAAVNVAEAAEMTADWTKGTARSSAMRRCTLLLYHVEGYQSMDLDCDLVHWETDKIYGGVFGVSMKLIDSSGHRRHKAERELCGRRELRSCVGDQRWPARHPVFARRRPDRV